VLADRHGAEPIIVSTTQPHEGDGDPDFNFDLKVALLTKLVSDISV
jgi:hypothetical protein